MLDSVQTKERVEEILTAHIALEGALLPILHAVQAEFGHVPQEALPIIAKALNMSRAEAHGVMTFYHDFREKPAGAHVVKLCRAEACQAVGANRVAAHAKKALGIERPLMEKSRWSRSFALAFAPAVRPRSSTESWSAAWTKRN